MFLRKKILQSVYHRQTGENSKILLLQGGRETGKTTLLHQIKDDAQYPADLQRVIFEFDQHDSNIQFEHEIELFKFLQLKTGIKTGEKTLVLLNEIQYSKNIVEMLCKLVQSYPEFQVIATTSGMDFQDHALSEAHQAMVKKMTITPYRFEEYLDYHGIHFHTLNFSDQNSSMHSTLISYFEQYLKRGSFPRVVEATSELDKINALKHIVKKYIDTDARFWFSGDFLITCEKAIGPLHSVTDQLLKPISLAKILKLSPYNTKKIVNFFLQTHCFMIVECFEDNRDLKNTLHGHQTIYSIDTGLLHHYIPFALSTEIYYKTFVANELLGHLGQDKHISTYRKRNGTQIDFIIEDSLGNFSVVICEEKNSGNIPRRLHAIPEHLLQRCNHIIICTPGFFHTTHYQQIPLQFCPYYRLPFLLQQKTAG